jgi:hypothetical protein
VPVKGAGCRLAPLAAYCSYNQRRKRYIQNLLQSEKGELTALDHEVLESLQQHETFSSNVDAEFDKDVTVSEKMADGLA